MRELERRALREPLRQHRDQAVVVLIADRLRHEDVAVARIRAVRRRLARPAVGQRAGVREVDVQRHRQVAAPCCPDTSPTAPRLRASSRSNGREPAVDANVLKSSAITLTSEITATPVGGVTLPRENAGAPAVVRRHVDVDDVAAVAAQEVVVGLRDHHVVVDAGAARAAPCGRRRRGRRRGRRAARGCCRRTGTRAVSGRSGFGFASGRPKFS